MHPLRNHKSYVASMGHRLSGIALALFLPFHFLLLGSAFDDADGLNQYLIYTDLWLVKIAEWGLVICLALHLFFGIRVLLLEFTNWPRSVNRPSVNRFAAWVVPCFAAALLIGFVFLAQVFRG